ncbi:hypothetical protein RJ639_046322 [Escallonia herrerae]|uniref:Reticulon-like protein n=1 Tax=Escallonia herrerae TaxID=1293975 RepID=A0AA88W6W6_9ASTE|nr:hypothetical protein RJ639_046322 [Escallonia herrerae]
MDVGRRRENGGVVAGSVWESRMKIDEVKGGIKVFNGQEENPPEGNEDKVPPPSSSTSNGLQVYKRASPKHGLVGVSGKRKTWKSENSESPVQISKQRSDISKNLDEQSRELSVSADEIKKSPVQNRKEGVSVDVIEKSPVKTLRSRSIFPKGSSDSSPGMERNSIQLRKVKSESKRVLDESGDEIEKNGELRKVKSDVIKDVSNDSRDGNEKNPVLELGNANEVNVELRDESGKEIEGSGDADEKVEFVETVKEFGVCEEEVITSNLGNVGQGKSPPTMELSDEEDGVDGDEEDCDEELEEEVDEEIKVEVPKKIVIEEKKIQQKNEKKLPISSIVRKQPPPVVNHTRVNLKPSRPRPRTDLIHVNDYSVDLVMWRDASKSAFVFGLGTFIIVSSSYTRDLNVSFISVISYLGLVYLALIFIFRSIICRGAIDMADTSQDLVVGEGEAIWLVKLILPYVNEFLLKLRALFSGDPATTLKLAVLLFILARCGSSITIWKMAKLGFFGVFTVPKVCSSYSTQLTAYGTFWLRRFRDAWESCSHKKAVAFAVFTLVWNLSSTVARIWAVFMLFVAFRYYQHSLMREDWVEDEARGGGEGSSFQGSKVGGHRQGRGPTLAEIKKQKKGS